MKGFKVLIMAEVIAMATYSFCGCGLSVLREINIEDRQTIRQEESSAEVLNSTGEIATERILDSNSYSELDSLTEPMSESDILDMNFTLGNFTCRLSSSWSHQKQETTDYFYLSDGSFLFITTDTVSEVVSAEGIDTVFTSVMGDIQEEYTVEHSSKESINGYDAIHYEGKIKDIDANICCYFFVYEGTFLNIMAQDGTKAEQCLSNIVNTVSIEMNSTKQVASITAEY